MLHALVSCVCALAALQPGTGTPPPAPLTLAATIPLPGVHGRIDHLAQRGQRVYIAARGNDSVEVVDLRESKVVGSIKGLPEPQGIDAGPSGGPGGELLMVACGGDGTVR